MNRAHLQKQIDDAHTQLRRYAPDLQPGSVIERRQVRMFGGDLYTLCLVDEVRSDKFCAHPMHGTFEDGATGMWFLRDMYGKTWR